MIATIIKSENIGDWFVIHADNPFELSEKLAIKDINISHAELLFLQLRKGYKKIENDIKIKVEG